MVQHPRLLPALQTAGCALLELYEFAINQPFVHGVESSAATLLGHYGVLTS